MIRGQVNAQRQAVIPLTVRGPASTQSIENAVLDSGFSGYIALKPSLIAVLGLPYVETRTLTVGDYRAVDFDLYEVTVEWDGHDRHVLAVSTESGPLVGMGMAQGFRVSMFVVDGGAVIIRRP